MRWLLLLLLFSGCVCRTFPPHVHGPGGWREMIDESEASCLATTFGYEMSREKRLRFEDSKVFYSDDKIDAIRLIFSTQNIIDIPEGRPLIVDVCEEFIRRVNDTLGNDLGGEPFGADRLYVYIHLESYENRYIDQWYLTYIAQEAGTTTFYAGDIKWNEIDSWHSRTEPYSKSVQFVNCEREAREAYNASHPERLTDETNSRPLKRKEDIKYHKPEYMRPALTDDEAWPTYSNKQSLLR